MKTNKTNVFKIAGSSCILSLVVLLACSTRTSPFYSLLMGDYTDNAVSASALAGYHWFCGVTPYRDLFVTEGPLYLLIQGLGYLVGGRYGILVLQWISMSCMFASMLQIGKQHSLKIRLLLLALTVIGYIALCSGGDSTAEWMLPCIFLLFYISGVEKAHPFITGVILGILTLISLEGIGIVIGFFLAQIVFENYKNFYRKKYVISCSVGLLIPWVIFCVYFYYEGAFGDFLKAAYMTPLKLAFAQMEDSAELTHKIVKCLLMAIPIFLVFITNKSHLSKEISRYCLWGAVLTVWLIIMPNSWYYYLICIPFICIAVMKYLEKALYGIGVASITLFFLIIPVKNYLTFIFQGTEGATEEFMDDLNAFIADNPDARVFFLNTDCSYYLESGLTLYYKYYYNQTNLSAVDPQIYDTVKDSLYGAESPSCIVNTIKGQYHEDYYEGYTLVQAYIKHGGNLQIYVAD